MTDQEWKARHKVLAAAATRTKNKARAVKPLAGKLVALSAAKIAEEALRQHRLKRFELTQE